MKYVYIKTPTPVMRAHKIIRSHPITSFAQFKIHESIEPTIAGKDANALSANLPSSHNRAFNLFLIHSLAPSPFPSPSVVPPDVVVVVTLEPPSRASTRTPMAIPIAVNIDTIVIPCSFTKCPYFFIQELHDQSPNLIDLFRSFTF